MEENKNIDFNNLSLILNMLKNNEQHIDENSIFILSPIPIFSSSIFSDVFSTGTDSPVSADSCDFKFIASIISFLFVPYAKYSYQSLSIVSTPFFFLYSSENFEK